METVNVETTNSTETESQVRVRMFKELAARQYLADMAQMNVEQQLVAIAEALGPTFEHEGEYAALGDANFLQIRQRYNKEADRKVPYVVGLAKWPKGANGPRTKAVLQIQEPVSESTYEDLQGEDPTEVLTIQ